MPLPKSPPARFPESHAGAVGNPPYASLQPVLPNRAEVFSVQNSARQSLLLFHFVSAELLLAQVPQLRRNACGRVMRKHGKLVERQPGVALACAEHDVTQHVALCDVMLSASQC